VLTSSNFSWQRDIHRPIKNLKYLLHTMGSTGYKNSGHYLSEVVRQAQESIKIPDFLESESMGYKSEGYNSLVFELIRKDQDGKYMRPFIYGNTIPESGEDIKRVFRLLGQNANILSIWDKYPGKEEEFTRKDDKGIQEKRSFIETLREEYIRWNVPISFAASGLIYYAWRAYNIDGDIGRKVHNKSRDRSNSIRVDDALFMRVYPGETSRSFLRRMAERFGFKFLNAENPTTVDALFAKRPLILPPGTEEDKESIVSISQEIIDRLHFFNWVEYSLVHQLVYGEHERKLLMIHYPLLIDGYCYVGFAYRIVPIGDNICTDRMDELREKNRLVRQSVFGPFAGFNLRDAIIDEEVDKIESEDVGNFLVSSRGWSEKIDRLVKQVEKSLFASFGGYSPINKESDKPAWLSDINDNGRDIDLSLRKIRRRIIEKLNNKRERLRSDRMYFHDQSFFLLNHTIKNFGDPITPPKVIDGNVSTFDLESISDRISQTNFRIFLCKMLGRAVNEFSGSSYQLVSCDDFFNNTENKCKEAVAQFDIDYPTNFRISPLRALLIYMIVKNEDEHGSSKGDGVIRIDGSSIKVDHQSVISPNSARDILIPLKELQEAREESLSEKVVAEEGVQIIVAVVERLSGAAEWIFRKGDFESVDHDGESLSMDASQNPSRLHPSDRFSVTLFPSLFNGYDKNVVQNLTVSLPVNSDSS